jgi:hypothetical protein
MNRREFDNLSEGDIIRHVNDGQGWLVHANYRSGGVLIVRSLVAHNPDEWNLVGKARYTEGESMDEITVEITVELPVHVYQRIQAEVADENITPDQWIAALVREQFSYSEDVGDDEGG